MKRAIVYISILFIAYSCDRIDSIKIESEYIPSPDTIINELIIKEKEEPADIYPFVEKLKKLGFGTDTNRLKVLASYAYWDLRNTPFRITNGILVSDLDIKNSYVLKWRKYDNKDSLFNTSLSNGVGFFFGQVDSNGIGLKNSFDFGLEIWDFKGIDTTKIIHDWKSIYYPMPLEIVFDRNKMYVFYTRRSVDYNNLLKYKEIIMKNTALII